jgi:ricin-type beta-trefoil lectin protein
VRKSGRLVTVLVISALVAAGAMTSARAASPTLQATCDASGSAGSVACQIGEQTVTSVSAITLAVTLESTDGQNNQFAELSWQGYCGLDAKTEAKIGSSSTGTPPLTPVSTGPAASVNVPLPYQDPAWCDISASATLVAEASGGTVSNTTTGSFKLAMEYTPAATASSSSSTSSSSAKVPLVKGYGGKCLDDKGNRSANRTEVILWTCRSADASQGWKFTNGELVHDGKCADDRANGGSGTKVILWTCARAPDETWSHTGSDGEFVLGSRTHGRLCLTDPGHSTANRTQLTVSACQNTSNQHWT